MRVTWLDALPVGTTSETVRRVLEAAAADPGGPLTVRAHRLEEARFAPCRGCFACWVEHPGTCRAKDSANAVMPDIIGADGVLWTTAPRFGAWDPVAKAALDKSIGLLSPFFSVVEGETHHRRRYRRYPRWAVLARVGGDTPVDERDVFRQLVARNAHNMHEGAPWVGFIDEDAPAEDAAETTREALRALAHPGPSTVPRLEAFSRPPEVGVPPRSGRHLVTLVGSAKPTGESTSEAFGAALERRLVARGWTAERLPVARVVKLRRPPAPALREAVARADLLVLAAPVYFDTLPALVLQALGQLADHAAQPAGGPAGPPALLPIVQCGFPELTHTALALEAAWRAGRACGFGWAGHLAVGGGGALQGDLDAPRGKLASQVRALDATAEALDAGEAVPKAALDDFARPLLPPALYRLAGDLGWLVQALQQGANPLTLGTSRPFPERP
ncbi:MAG TPA: hypothetical protein RMF84_03360 [Polyangiaceae bacterium LLY-WYZ-14_1]|nr:hypothetical protein [Polyangiaceae bacterium LLY-WYZ-14_1]